MVIPGSAAGKQHVKLSPDRQLAACGSLTNAVRGVVPITSLDGAPAPRIPAPPNLAGHFWPPA